MGRRPAGERGGAASNWWRWWRRRLAAVDAESRGGWGDGRRAVARGRAPAVGAVGAATVGAAEARSGRAGGGAWPPGSGGPAARRGSPRAPIGRGVGHRAFSAGKRACRLARAPGPVREVIGRGITSVLAGPCHPEFARRLRLLCHAGGCAGHLANRATSELFLNRSRGQGMRSQSTSVRWSRIGSYRDAQRPRPGRPFPGTDAAAAAAGGVHRAGQGERNAARFSSPRPRSAASRSTTCCSTARPASARRRWPRVLANEMGARLSTTSGPAIERPGDLAAILTNLQKGDVLFIDEIHRLQPRGRGGALPGDGGLRARHHRSARGRRAQRCASTCRRFTLIGATTRLALLTVAAARPLRRRPTASTSTTPRRWTTIVSALGAASSASPIDARAARGDRAPRARHAAHRQPPAAARARLRRRCAADGVITERGRARRAEPAGDRSARPRRHRPPHPARDHRQVRRRPGRPRDPRRRDLRGAPTRSRTSTSRT